MEIILAVTIAVLGWIITHILTIRAQNKSFINQVINDARLEISKAIRDYQDWLNKIHVIITSSSFDIVIEESGFSVNWSQKITEFKNKIYSDKSNLQWGYRLEEYEILFPKTAKCRKSLLDRHTQVQDYIYSFLQQLLEQTSLDKRKKFIEKAQKGSDILFDQIALMEDLRIYLQNLCLSSFTGNKIPERKPEDLSVPRLIEDNKGYLQIVVTNNTAKSE